MFANNYCTQCLCVWDKLNYPVVTTPNTSNKPTDFEFSLTWFHEIFSSGCEIAGDRYCDDATNDGKCNFDGGDCCLPNKKTEYCEFCTCYADQPTGKKFKNFIKTRNFSKNPKFRVIRLLGLAWYWRWILQRENKHRNLWLWWRRLLQTFCWILWMLQ